MVRGIRFHKFLVRSFLKVVFLIIVPIGVFISLYSIHMQKILLDEIGQMSQNELQRDADIIEEVLNQVKALTYNFISKGDIKKFPYLDEESAQYINALNSIEDDIALFTATYDYIDSMYVYFEKGDRVLYERKVISLEQLRDQSWLSSYEKLEKKIIVQFRRKNDYYPYYLSVICPIWSDVGNMEGAIIANVNIEEMNDLFLTGDSSMQQFWVDDELRLYFSSDYKWIGSHDYAPEYLSFLKDHLGTYSEIQTISEACK